MKSGTFPKPHLFLSSAMALLLIVLAFGRFDDDDGDRFTTEAVLVDLPTLGTTTAHASGAPAADADAAAAADEAHPSGDTVVDALVPPMPAAPGDAAVITPPLSATPTAAPPSDEPGHRTTSVRVRPGDNLSLIFKREDIPAREVHRLLTSEPLGQRLANIYPGHELTLTRDADGTLVKLAYTPGPLETLEFERVGDRFEGRETMQEPKRSTVFAHGVIDHSLFVASQRAGLPDALTMRLAHIFQWDVDFVLDIRQGDEFHVVYEELHVGDEFVGYGDILAAEFTSRGRSFRAIRYTDSRGDTDYYNVDGDPMRKAFLRAPVEFSRISSNFNLRRKHPLHKRSMPHRGIDYAAPTGTPVLSSGDGRVKTASRTEPNGNYLVIRHGEQFTTKYLHLSRFARGIRSGSRVEQGQVIGYVGATGWATGPHLHYEFLVNGVHKNPRTVALPEADPIPAEELERFEDETAPLLAILDDFKNQQRLAAAH